MIDWRDVMAEDTYYAIVNDFSIVGRISQEVDADGKKGTERASG